MEKHDFYRKTIAGLAFCFGFLIFGTTIFIKSEHIDYYTCIYLFKRVLPYSCIIGLFGYYIGKIIDNAYSKPLKRKKR